MRRNIDPRVERLRSFGHPQERGDFGPWRGRGRRRKGDVREAVLALLAERPMHGYEMLAELEERTEGVWRPSPGSVYPTLQLLEDEGLVQGEKAEGKRMYALTDAGREHVEARSGKPAPWEEVTDGISPAALNLRGEIASVFNAAQQVMMVGSNDQQARALQVLAEARRRLYGILAAEDTPEAAEAGTHDEPED
jgi:DNA-binding PadR family transcriptional regulator